MANVRKAVSLLMSALREIFDENAYARFLARQGRADCRESYREFVRDSRSQIERRPRCC